MAEVKWFYRVSELPEALYLMLMEDRKEGDQVVAVYFQATFAFMKIALRITYQLDSLVLLGPHSSQVCSASTMYVCM